MCLSVCVSVVNSVFDYSPYIFLFLILFLLDVKIMLGAIYCFITYVEYSVDSEICLKLYFPFGYCMIINYDC